jgi:hypothetical protein
MAQTNLYCGRGGQKKNTEVRAQPSPKHLASYLPKVPIYCTVNDIFLGLIGYGLSAQAIQMYAGSPNTETRGRARLERLFASRRTTLNY